MEVNTMERYDQLTEDQKEHARKMCPNDYTEWLYKTIGVKIEFAAR